MVQSRFLPAKAVRNDINIDTESERVNSCPSYRCCPSQSATLIYDQKRMRAVVQRVSRAQVSVGDEVVGQIGPGLLVLLGVAKTDTQADADYLAAKVLGLRIFEDENGKMNLSVLETGGSILAVSQFTLYGDVRKGKRPSFDEAAPPALARELYEYFVAKIRESGVVCETGRFQAMMQVELVNDGPVTILVDSKREF